MRSAAVAGAAYVGGKRVGRRHERDDEYMAQDAPAAPAPAPAPAAPVAPAAAAAAPMSAAQRVDALKDLKGLLDSGVLSQAEFDHEKERILAGS